jgi:flagellar basal-body rod modification protein FlgD
MTTVNNSGFTANLASITRTADAKQTQKTPAAGMGKDDFLRLFTTQLKNQDPTDPVKNEAFVAQLAQFSQLEASTNMANSLAQLAAVMQGDRLLSASGLIGRTIEAPAIPATLSGGNPVRSSINLDAATEDVSFTVVDAAGNKVRSSSLGPQAAGTLNFDWDGKDEAGVALPDGSYRISANVKTGNTQRPVAVAVPGLVSSVGADSVTKELMLTLQNGANVPFSSITRLSR